MCVFRNLPDVALRKTNDASYKSIAFSKLQVTLIKASCMQELYWFCLADFCNQRVKFQFLDLRNVCYLMYVIYNRQILL